MLHSGSFGYEFMIDKHQPYFHVCPLCEHPVKTIIGLCSHLSTNHGIARPDYAKTIGLTNKELSDENNIYHRDRKSTYLAVLGLTKEEVKEYEAIENALMEAQRKRKSEEYQRRKKEENRIKRELLNIQKPPPVVKLRDKFPLPEKTIGFFESREWRELRYATLKRYGAKCMLCGATPESGAIIQVDHIIPRAKWAKGELDPENLQVLCRDCNSGKGYKDETDWRRK